MGLALFAFLAVFLLIGSAGFLLLTRAGLSQRLSAVVEPQQGGWLKKLKWKGAGSSLGAAIKPFEKVVPKSALEISVVQKRLMRAGLRNDAHLRILYGAKVLVPLGLCFFVWATGLADMVGAFFAYAIALAIGYLVPDFWLGRRIKARQENIRLSLPDFLDLMIVCMEAGLSLDQAIARAKDELEPSQPELADELGLFTLEQRAGHPRADCWKNLAERVDLDVMNALVSALNQADRFGTSIAKTLRIYADTLRTQRRQRVEEMAAKLPVKLVFPLVLFIFPSLYVVALGPAMIVMIESFSKYFGA
jgi:tight adherence protein C